MCRILHIAVVTKKQTPRINQLLDDIQEVTDQGLGTLSDLSEFLGVSRFHLYKWVTAREYEPSGEVTLAMLEWVTAQRDKQKSPGRASTRPERKARKGKSLSHEKPQSSPPP
jgi:hypothetical protein